MPRHLSFIKRVTVSQAGLKQAVRAYGENILRHDLSNFKANTMQRCTAVYNYVRNMSRSETYKELITDKPTQFLGLTDEGEIPALSTKLNDPEKEASL